MPKQNFFSPVDEKITLWIPIIGLSLAVIQLVFFVDTLNSWNKDLVRLFVNVILLNGTHLGFPFVMLLAFPKGRELMRRKVKSVGLFKLTGIVSLVVGGIAFAAYFEAYYRGSNSSLRENFLIGMAWIWIIIPTFHGMRQSGGISLLMNRSLKSQLSEDQRLSLSRFEKTERRLFLGVYVGVVLGLITIGSEFFEPRIEKTASVLFFLGASLSAMRLLYLIRKEPIFRDTNKFIYSIRMLFWPLGLLSTLATWLLPLMHGQEYLALFNKAVKEEEDRIVRTRAVKYLLITVLALASLSAWRFYLDYFSKGETGMDPLVTHPYASFFLLLIPLVTLLHYLTDSVMYRMADPDVRETMGKMYPSYFSQKN